MAASAEKESELVGPHVDDETWMDRAAGNLRRTLDVVSALTLVYAFLSEGDASSTAVYLLLMLGIFPHAKLAEHLRRKPDAPWVMIVTGLVLALYMLGTSAFGPGLLRHVLPGVGLALVGWGCLLLVRSPAGSAISRRRFALGVAAIAVNALGVVLVLAPAGAAAHGA